ncbi:putative RNA-binding protein sce3 [Leucoagaricus sp. SymC.cos]|nr:putative RNA-binding protein sce3 [Leucoagaricus sp. SymC.cos]
MVKPECHVHHGGVGRDCTWARRKILLLFIIQILLQHWICVRFQLTSRRASINDAFLAPKKVKKIALSEFLGDPASGSWADEMDSLPIAPAPKDSNEHPSRRDDFLSSRPDRAPPVREDVPLPTQPPYTAFVGNLAFDLIEGDLETFFQGVKSAKIIKDRDDKPKGFGYVEFENLDDLKAALTNSGQVLAGRTIRVSVAEPPKERGFSHTSSEDNSKFDSPWRREGPLPDLPHARDPTRRKFEGATEKTPSVSDAVNDWRSQRPSKLQEPEIPKRKGSGFFNEEPSTVDKEETWTMGSKFKPSADEGLGNRFGSLRAKPDAAPSPADEGDWRSSARPRPTRSNVSPSGSTPPTPQMGRRKLELLPRSGGASASPSPLSSPKMGSASTSSRSNPFGTAKPVDVSAKEKEILERVDKDRERLSMSRTNSRSGSERPARPRTPPPSTAPGPATSSPRAPARTLAPNVRSTLSFANVAANKERASASEAGIQGPEAE